MVAGDPAKNEADNGASQPRWTCRSARFVLSASKVTQLPADSEAEVAFAGRSNAGKSSVINTLSGNAKLARISKTPGRTQALNCFRVASGRYLIDLPGYGYAKVSHAQRNHWHHELGRYFLERDALHGLLLIVDIRRGLTELDWQLIAMLRERRTPLHCLLNKADKLASNAAHNSLHRTRQQLREHAGNATVQLFSASKRRGIDECCEVLGGWLA
jgi:GTP-binding protein